MKAYFKYATVLAISLLGLWSCSSDDETQEASGGKTPVAQPQIIVHDLTTTGFTLRWEAVNDAGGYIYTFNGGSETSITECRIAFNELERQKEYVVAIKAIPRDKSENTESAYTYVHVLTDDLEQLPQPQVTLGCAYASKTIITWSEVPETALYEYTIGEESYTTSERIVTLGGLKKGEAYTFSVRAMTNDATRFSNSEATQLPFTTSTDDIPALIVIPTTVISDAVAFNVYANSSETYYYDVVPVSTFMKFSSEQIMSLYQESIIEFAKKQGISLQLAMASVLKSGTQEIQVTGLTPELSYVAFVFGMNLKGQITTSLFSTRFKTTADGYSDGPNYGGSAWFSQKFFISNAYLPLTGYGWTNSVFTTWKGESVTDIRYRTLSAKIFNQVFPDPYDKQALAAFLKDPDYGLQFNPELLAATVNSSNGYEGITNASAGTSYTLLTLATSSSGEETLCVNSTTTKTSQEAVSWFMARAVTHPNYGPVHNTVAGAMQGIDIASTRYVIFKAGAIKDVPTSQYAALVEMYGHDVDEQYIPYINGGGFAIIFPEEVGIEPQQEYTFIATAVNIAGDKLTKWGSVTTGAAPAEAGPTARTRSAAAGKLSSPVGQPIANPERFIYPMEVEQLPAGARPEGDLWTLIHNMQILK